MLRYGLLAATLTFAQLAAVEQTPETPTEVSQEDINNVSEAFGHFIGKSLATPGLDLNIDLVIKGIRNGYAGKESPLSEEDYQAKMMAVQTNAFKKIAEKNLTEANQFMEKNTKESGVKEIEPGKLQYKILKEGSGSLVKEGSSPEINYTGKFLDGQTFGSSEQAGSSITIPLDHTISGFSKGLVGMKEGEKRRLFVHPELGYGMSGQLPPNSLLIFDIEVVKADAKPAAEVQQSESEDDDEDLDDDEEETQESSFNWSQW